MMKLKLMTIFFLISSLFFISCGDDDSTEKEVVPQKSNVRVIHASHDAPAVDVLIDDAKAVDNLAYGKSSGYAEVDAGNRNVKVVATGTTTPVLIEATPTLTADKYYSVFAVNTAAKIEAVVAEDTGTADAAKATVRFVHASPDAPEVDIKIKKEDGTVVSSFSAVKFKDVEDFIKVDPGTYSVAINVTGETEVAVAYKGYEFKAGDVLTVVAHGTIADDDYDFGVRVFTDKGDGKTYVDLEGIETVEDKADVRVIHTSYDAPAVDVLIDDTKALDNLAYGKSSGYAKVDAGTRNVKVVETGTTTPVLIEANPDFMKGKHYSVFAVNKAESIEAIVAEDMVITDQAKVTIRFVHAIPDAPAIDIKKDSGDGTAVFSNVAFKDVEDYIKVDPGSYTFVLTGAGVTEELVKFKPVNLTAGSILTVVAQGTVSPMDAYDSIVRVFNDTGDGVSYVDLEVDTSVEPKSNVRVIHTSYDAPAVDVLLDDTKAVDNLTYGGTSGYAEIDAGVHNVKVVETGTTTPVFIEANPDFMVEKYYTVFAVNNAANIEAIIAEDTVTADEAKVTVRFVHASPDAPAVDIKLDTGDGTAVFTDVAFKDVEDYVKVDPASYTFVVTATGDTTEVVKFQPINLTAGMVLTVVAHGTLNADDAYDFGVRAFVDTGDGDTYVDLSAVTK